MSKYLKSEENPEGHALEDILLNLRADVIKRCDRIAMDHRPEAIRVLRNNIKILELLSDAAELSLESAKILDRAFGPSQAGIGAPPRIGTDERAA